MLDKPESKKLNRGYPETRELKLHIMSEEGFRRVFDAAKPPDPSIAQARK